MLIDWFTVGAQALNFLVLAWLMKRFLYRPILDAIDAREKHIAGEIADADKKKAEAAAERDEFKRKNEAFEQQRSELLSKATQDASAERSRLLGVARTTAEAMNVKLQEASSNEAANLKLSIRRRVQHEVFAIARQTLADLATTSVEAAVVDVFIARLHALGGESKAVLAAALESAAEPAVVRSAFDLSAPQQAAIQQALDVSFSTGVRVRFDTAPDLISGIELRANGQGVGWTISAYLDGMEKSVGELMAQPAKVECAEIESKRAAVPQTP